MAGSVSKIIINNLRATLPKHMRKELKYNDSVRFMTGSSGILGPIGHRDAELNEQNFVRKKISDIMLWYEEVTGMDEVRRAQNRVLEAEENFIAAQERRREANKEVAAVQVKLKELYGELDNTTRGEERYVQLITQEHRVLKEEKRLAEGFSRFEREERDYFSSLSTAVKDSHEKERAQAEKTKYWSIIGSIIGTVIGIFGSSINNEIKMKQLRRLVQESLVSKNTSNNVPEALTKHEKELSLLVNEMKIVASQPNDQVLVRLNEIIHNYDTKSNEKGSDVTLKNMLNILNSQKDENIKQFDELKSIVRSQYIVSPDMRADQVVVMPIGLEDRLNKQYKEAQYIVIGSTVVAIIVPIICKYIGLT